MILQIELGQSDVTLKLVKNGTTIDVVTIKYYYDLSDVLITGLDKLLERNKLDLKSLKSYKIHNDLGQDSTSYKIASAFVRGLQI
ncbi:MAG: hypothetical protein HYT65_02130 [Candidatus Yanofskybacteria bacterium]|nr:hypothetical protein [Candidatus Yanofskybacteria bacterium]